MTSANRELLEQKVKPALTAFLAQRGLQLSEQKTVLTHIQAGFDFLGHTVRKDGDKLLISPAKSKVARVRRKIGALIQAAGGLSQEALLRQLNPLLRGWANYYRNGASPRTFAKLDYYVYRQLQRWMHRRHPSQSKAWKQQKYFTAAGDKGAFSVRLGSKTGANRVLALYRVASTQIERHLKVRGTANPYDPKDTEYFQKRRCLAWRVRWSRRTPTTVPAA